MKILILSPHRDDAAFSLGLAINGWLDAQHDVTVLGVFTRSLYAPYSDAGTVHPNDRLSYVSAMRRREDAELLKTLPGLRMIDLNLKDAPLRLRCLAEDVYTLAPSPDDTAIAKIQKVLAKLAAEDTVDAIFLPLALGHHVDHIVVRNSALEFAAGRPCAFYEEFPDALTSGVDTEELVQREISTLRASGLFDEALTPVILRSSEVEGTASKMKRRIVSIYASQIDETTIDSVVLSAEKYAGGERVRANPAWLALPL